MFQNSAPQQPACVLRGSVSFDFSDAPGENITLPRRERQSNEKYGRWVFPRAMPHSKLNHQPIQSYRRGTQVSHVRLLAPRSAVAGISVLCCLMLAGFAPQKSQNPPSTAPGADSDPTTADENQPSPGKQPSDRSKDD